MTERAKRKPRSFYLRTLDEAERLEFQAASNIEGIDDEITLMRMQINDLVHQEDLDDLVKAMRTLARLVSTRYNISRHDKKGIKEAIGNVLRDIALPLGISLGTKL